MNFIIFVIIYFMIFLGFVIMMFSINLMLMWVGLEFSLLVIIFMLINKKNLWLIEVVMKYFVM